MGELFHNKYRIESTRLKENDYDDGYYFVTICTKHREHFFGEITNGEMNLSKLGLYTYDVIIKTPEHQPECIIENIVVMPNHIHAIIRVLFVKNNKVECINDDKNVVMAEISRKKGRLSIIIGSIKSAVTKYANDNGIYFQWQPRFHDHVIRGYDEYCRIMKYINENIKKWDEDCFRKNSG